MADIKTTHKIVDLDPKFSDIDVEILLKKLYEFGEFGKLYEEVPGSDLPRWCQPYILQGAGNLVAGISKPTRIVPSEDFVWIEQDESGKYSIEFVDPNLPSGRSYRDLKSYLETHIPPEALNPPKVIPLSEMPKETFWTRMRSYIPFLRK